MMHANNRRRFAGTHTTAGTQASPGELLQTSYMEMLDGYRNIYDRTGDLFLKEIIERAEHALAENQ